MSDGGFTPTDMVIATLLLIAAFVVLMKIRRL
jgi:hypothetical protein